MSVTIDVLTPEQTTPVPEHTLEQFKYWLKSKGEEICGQSGQPQKCPVAMYYEGVMGETVSIEGLRMCLRVRVHNGETASRPIQNWENVVVSMVDYSLLSPFGVKASDLLKKIEENANAFLV